MSVERGRVPQAPINFSGIGSPNSGTWNPRDALEKVKIRDPPYNASHPSEEVKNKYEQVNQLEYYSERPLNATDRNYKERVEFEEQLPQLAFYVNMVALKILTLENAGNDIVVVVREQLKQFLFPETPLHKTVAYYNSVKNLCAQITNRFPNATHDEKIWILQWIDVELRKKKVKKGH
jgi:hypothetical protein